MAKVFEDYFTEIQADMVSLCMEYVEKRAEKIYIYCSYENRTMAGNFFYKANGKIAHKHELNDVKDIGAKQYDVSVDRQCAALDIIIEDIEALIKLCQEHKREMPTQIKLVYDLTTNKLSANYGYDLYFTDDPDKTADTVFDEWYQEEANKYN